MSLGDVVPSEFYLINEESPYVETVGEMIKQLHRLPDDLPVKQGLGVGCRLF
jgi:hypothetical protein